MKFPIIIPLIVLSALMLVHGADDDAITGLIRRLGSSSFQEREKASEALRDRPDAAPALRQALRSPDREVAKRAAGILDYFERRPIRELNAAVKAGQVERAVQLLADWPKGKFEEEAWAAVRQLGLTLVKLHEKQGGEKIDVVDLLHEHPPLLISDKRITETTKARSPGRYFVRAGDVDLDYSRIKPQKWENGFFADNLVVVARDTVRTPREPVPMFIAAGGNVDLLGGDVRNVIIISAGDVSLTNCELNSALVIAKGKVTATKRNRHSRLISGQEVALSKKATHDCIITENESNPLGYIRWAEEKKEKSAPKGK